MEKYNDVQISFLIPAKNASSFLENTLKVVIDFLEVQFKNSFEIILILNGDNLLELNKMQFIANQFKEKSLALKICHSTARGKGSALKEGFLISKGKNIFFTDADLPYDLSFFLEAHTLLANGHQFVTGNRRFPNSLFTLPVSVLPLAYGRHRVGLLFNKIVRTLFKIKSHDTQAGIKAFSRSLGERVYSRKTCPGFLFDLEFFIIAMKNGYKHTELPIHLHLKSEKSTVRILKESLETAYWLSKIYFQNLRKYYYFESDEINFNKHYFITADDWGISPSVNRGILKLAQKGIVTRVSVMADGLYVGNYLDELKSIKGIELGLHLNFTHENYFKSPIDLLVNMIGPFKKQQKELLVKNEIKRQYDIMKKFDINVSYADGHHHCHIFPGVVNAFSHFLQEKNINETRLPLSWSFLFSEKILLLIFSINAKTKFDRLGISYRPFFYPDFEKIDSTDLLRKQLSNKIGHEIITHPSDLADFTLLSINDRYNHGRVKEFNLLTDLVAQEC